MKRELIQIEEEVKVCTKCPLHRSRKKTVPGMGNHSAGVFLIGEGPGFDEDRTGLPFVGKSGRLLDRILEVCGFTRENHVFIGNIVKCRPPENRPPHVDEQETCLPYLMRQIDLVDPSIIVLLGSTALNAMVDRNAKITKARGIWMEWTGRQMIATYHPSALLRNPSLKRDAWEDFKEVVMKYRELVNSDHTSEYVD